ncbi:MAG: hypothetical protein ABSD49_12540 [Candidatus Bathyarchaeia archaeon]
MRVPADPHAIWKTSSATLLKNLDDDDHAWVKMFRSRLDEKAASTALDLGKLVYGLPSGSEQILRGAVNRWRDCSQGIMKSSELK